MTVRRLREAVKIIVGEQGGGLGCFRIAADVQSSGCKSPEIPLYLEERNPVLRKTRDRKSGNEQKRMGKTWNLWKENGGYF